MLYSSSRDVTYFFSHWNYLLIVIWRLNIPIISGMWTHREKKVAEAAAINTVCKTRRLAGGFFVSELRQSASQNLAKALPWQGFVRLTGAIPNTF